MNRVIRKVYCLRAAAIMSQVMRLVLLRARINPRIRNTDTAAILASQLIQNLRMPATQLSS